MLRKTTVMILGAGASHPYKFPTGGGLLGQVRAYSVEQMAEFISPRPRAEAVALFRALRDTGEDSIDSVLEGQEDIRPSGKNLIARMLLQCERNARDLNPPHDPDGAWYRELYGAMLGRSLDDFRANPLSIFTYNYDRSLENFLITALSAKYRDKTREQCAQALEFIGPWHLHGKLGSLPESLDNAVPVVPYGGDIESLTDANVHEAATGMTIVDEPNPRNDAFARAHDAFSKAEQIVFLGFGFGETNVSRLSFDDCRDNVELFATAMGPPRQQSVVSQALAPWHVQVGHFNEGTLAFLQRWHNILERTPRSLS